MLPIIAGFHPDPSICRAGDWYYLANSSFEYVPGVPIHRSRDMLTWELVGHALPDADAVHAATGRAGASQGIYAPTLRHHGGRFWMVTTSIADVMRGQLITHADDPAGPWSAPVRVDQTFGIDPDLAWDDEGACYLTYRGFMPPGIHQVKIDPATGERLGEDRVIWHGSGLGESEGPHLFRRGDWWYLVVAEGGTHTGHAVSVARSRAPEGPFENNPENPILSHRSTAHPVQATGHADLVETADGSWALVHLGIRQRGAFPRFHVLGRETFLAGVDWVEGWPVVVEGRYDAPGADPSFDDAFEGTALDARWVAPGVAPSDFAVPSAGLRLEPSRDAESSEQHLPLCTRLRSFAWKAVVAPGDGDMCVSVRLAADHWLGLERVGDAIRARQVSAHLDATLGAVRAEPGDTLVIEATPTVGRQGGPGPDTIELAVERAGERVSLARVDGRHLSTEVVGGFTGRMLALEALGGPATVRSVALTELEEPAPPAMPWG
ncbi:glycoside hydrolase family 43 protein [Demequina phytophila]|uniref:glycoside hydrolase family 43 protein n=1 Tax=Demequina phytophila TaxID=1638981 RepID=UPI0007819D73|nr:glycoside hydrolase family 43 protein [Demequina phytophila]